MLCYTIQFDMLYWPLWCDARQVNTFDTIRRQFGIGGDENASVEFIPYWENKKFVSSHPEVKVGYYEKNFSHDPYAPEEKSQSFLLLISNPEFKQNEFSVSIPAEFSHVNITDRYSKKKLQAKDGKVSMKLEPFSFAVLEVTVSE